MISTVTITPTESNDRIAFTIEDLNTTGAFRKAKAVMAAYLSHLVEVGDENDFIETFWCYESTTEKSGDVTTHTSKFTDDMGIWDMVIVEDHETDFDLHPLVELCARFERMGLIETKMAMGVSDLMTTEGLSRDDAQHLYNLLHADQPDSPAPYGL